MTRFQALGRRRAERGFTLVELLVVVAIIGLLVAILLPALYTAFGSVTNAARKTEVVQLAQAIEAFKVKYGAYPPDFSDQARVIAFFRRAFPRSVDAPPSGLNRAQALVFWLGGFSPDATRPITGGGERSPFYQFDAARLQAAGAYQVYLPKESTAPYVYFEAGVNGAGYANGGNSFSGMGSGTARPYRSDVAAQVWCNPKSFQIISAGQDDDFGTRSGDGSWPSGANYSIADRDNVVNFNEKATLGDDMP